MSKSWVEYKDNISKFALQAAGELLERSKADTGKVVSHMRSKVEFTGVPELDVANLLACIQEYVKTLEAKTSSWL